MKKDGLTGLLRLAIDPFGNGVMNLLASNGFGFVRLFETVPDHACAYVWVAYVCHPCCSPERYGCSARHFFRSIQLNSSLPLCVWLCVSVKPNGHPVYKLYRETVFFVWIGLGSLYTTAQRGFPTSLRKRNPM